MQLTINLKSYSHTHVRLIRWGKNLRNIKYKLKSAYITLYVYELKNAIEKSAGATIVHSTFFSDTN